MGHQLFQTPVLIFNMDLSAEWRDTADHRPWRMSMTDRFPNDRRIESAAVSTPRFVLGALTDSDEETGDES